MKIILKIFRYLFITITVVLVILISLTLVFQGRITQIFKTEANKYSETGLDVEKVSFSLIKGFPRATVEFKNIHIESPATEINNMDSIPDIRNFLEAEFLFVSFNVRDIINKKYAIDRITAKNGKLLIIKDSLGVTSKRILKKEFKNDTAKISFDLDNIRLDNIGFIYINAQNRFLLDCKLDNAEGKLELAEGKTNIEVKGEFDISSLKSKERIILNPISGGSIKGELILSEDSIYFKQLDLVVSNQALSVDGSVCKKEQNLKLNIVSDNTNLDLIINKFPVEKAFRQGIVLYHQNTSLSLNFKAPLESFSATVHSFRAKYAGSDYAGSLALKNLVSPNLDLMISSNVDLAKLYKSHPVDKLEAISGEAHINARFRGVSGRLNTFSIDKLLGLKRKINLHLSDVDLKLSTYAYPVQNISGNIMIADNIWADELSFLISGQNMVMNCKIDDAGNLLKKGGKDINITAGIWADKVDYRLFLPSPGTEKQENKIKDRPGFKDRVVANLIINIDSLIINKFHSSQFDGIINYRPGFININSFNLLSLDGSLSGNTTMIKNSGSKYSARGWFDIQNVDINKAFTVFNNFGQQQLLADNIRGELSGSFSISTELDSSFKPIPSSLAVSGNYSITDGELLGFEPVLKLSRFIEVSELENIKFQNMKNDLIIANQRLLIPSMEINSSAFNIFLSGEQDFSGPFEYHLSVLLSEILSKKARRSGSYVSEFGPVEDDGLGKTTLFLKLEKDKAETRVSYDVKKLSEEIKVSLQQEKQSLKTILNEEYGWYKSDSLAAKVNNSKRFRITWEEADSIKTIQEPTGGKSGIFKKIFKSDTLKKKF